MRRGLFFALSLVLVLLFSATSVYGFQARVTERDVVYCTYHGQDLLMDLYYPESKDTQLPVVVYVHGGGWYSGDKTNEIGQNFIPELLKRGYLVAAINYRLAPRYAFPAQIEDVKCAVRFLRGNAAKYGLDPDNVGVFGESAGGHLAAMLGVTDMDCGFDCSGACMEQSSQVQAVVDMFGPSDLTLFYQEDKSMFYDHVFGTDDPESNTVKRASPVNYVSYGDAPFLIIQGDKDDIVLANQSEVLYQKLAAAGVPASLVMVKNAGHEFAPVDGAPSPDLPGIRSLVGNFFDQYLK